MFKLKSKKFFLKNAIPLQRVSVYNIPISELTVRLHKFPHLALYRPETVSPGEIQFIKKTLRSKYWTRRFFSMTVPALQYLQNGFKYQLRKFGLDISYKIIWHLLPTEFSYDISTDKFKPYIGKKTIRLRKVLYHQYRFAIHQWHEKIAPEFITTKHEFQLAASGFSRQKMAVDFSNIKDIQAYECTIAQPTISFQNPINPAMRKTKISRVPISRFDTIEDLLSTSLAIKTSISGDIIPALTSPQIHHGAVNSLYVYASGKKLDREIREESHDVIEIELDEDVEY
jgi:hypothetical protein